MLFGNLPLHAMIVHLPIALTVLVPLFAAIAFVMMRRGVSATRAWLLHTGMLGMLLVSGWVSLQTGEQQEDRVERVVPEVPFEAHEEAAELFLVVTGGVLVLAAGGLIQHRAAGAFRVASTVGTLAILGAGYNVGHSGGELVYTYGAASAYVPSDGGSANTSGNVSARVRGSGDADDDR